MSAVLCACGCGRPAPINRRGVQQRFLKSHHHGLKREANPNWRGGRNVKQGYVWVRSLGHPRASAAGYVAEHILVAEKALGRFLPQRHPVHHFDENRANNVGGNLVICEDDAYHKLLHRRMRALEACGDPNARMCSYCKQHDRQDDITVSTSDSRGYERAYHRSCAAAAEARRRERRAAQTDHNSQLSA